MRQIVVSCVARTFRNAHDPASTAAGAGRAARRSRPPGPYVRRPAGAAGSSNTDLTTLAQVIDKRRSTAVFRGLLAATVLPGRRVGVDLLGAEVGDGAAPADPMIRP
ncbi:hypothetical protein MCAG_03531 [Micromonospora sp. ATCC 39149]|nr:hypothetical protein MCAG_03531 [Micromonospora sp. ATCC 39149]